MTGDDFSPQQVLITTQINKNTDIQEIFTFLKSGRQERPVLKKKLSSLVLFQELSKFSEARE